MPRDSLGIPKDSRGIPISLWLPPQGEGLEDPEAFQGGERAVDIISLGILRTGLNLRWSHEAFKLSHGFPKKAFKALTRPRDHLRNSTIPFLEFLGIITRFLQGKIRAASSKH